jgi:hypothetical protein
MARDGLDLAEPLVDGLIELRIEARAAERSRQIRILAAMAGSLSLHLPLLLAVLAVGCDQGRSKAHSESISLEAVETFIVEAVPEIPNPALPVTSMPQQATSADADTMDRDGKDQRPPSKSLERLVTDRTEWPKLVLQAPPEVEPIQERATRPNQSSLMRWSPQQRSLRIQSHQSQRSSGRRGSSR